MGQASSVQREPSMEEILASIRRIIEDSDASRKGAGEFDIPTSAEQGPEPTDIAAFRTGLREQSTTDGAKADVSSEQFGAASGFPPLPKLSEAAAEAPASLDFSFSAPASLRTETFGAQPSDEIEMELDIDGFDETSEAGESRVGDGVPPAEAPAGEVRPSIISEHAGRQVATSFGELSDALAARSRKSFDQIAEEMLRPMLQDWLDNNLPHLVEKLVREEIERIARGTAAPR